MECPLYIQQIQSRNFNSRNILFANRMSLGELGQGQRDFNLASIPVVCLIGMIYVQRLDLHQPLRFLRKSYCPKPAPPAKSVFGIHDPIGLSYLTQLRVALSKLNFHKFKHNFRDTINPMCPTNDGIENTEHFLLLCPSFEIQRRNLLARVFALLRPLGYVNIPNEPLTHLLLYGDKDFPNDLNKNILELTLEFIHETGRFD